MKFRASATNLSSFIKPVFTEVEKCSTVQIIVYTMKPLFSKAFCKWYIIRHSESVHNIIIPFNLSVYSQQWLLASLDRFSKVIFEPQTFYHANVFINYIRARFYRNNHCLYSHDLKLQMAYTISSFCKNSFAFVL